MSRIIETTSIRETRLWQTLAGNGDEESEYLSATLVPLCEEAADRMKAMFSQAPQYTLHDERHLVRVAELMGLLIDPSCLNSIELALLILSAFFHDQGMVVTGDEMQVLEEEQTYQIFKDDWKLEHPNYREIEDKIKSAYSNDDLIEKLGSQIAELDAALLTAYIRQRHGFRSREYVISTYTEDKRMEIQGVSLAPFVAKLCESHTLPSTALTPDSGYHYDEQIGTYSVNMPFLATILRLADILDFDRDRTPEVLLKSIHFTSNVSLGEWEKHRSVEGWYISVDLVRYTVRCSHPAYEKAVRQYMDWIDQELLAAKEINRSMPRGIEGYDINLPSNVDRSRIGPANGAYRYHDLEFVLLRDEVVHLLMTDQLYSGSHLAIRELLQNSLDALRYRKALNAESGLEWTSGRVSFRHFVNSDGYEILECMDNGAGMDEGIVKDHLVKVGRSFYRSPFFEKERNRLRKTGHDFDPCSKFGIGFMSCFMLGDRITIKTRRDYGHGREFGLPLVVEINGLSGIIVIREGNADQPIGTTVTIVVGNLYN